MNRTIGSKLTGLVDSFKKWRVTGFEGTVIIREPIRIFPISSEEKYMYELNFNRIININ